MRAIAACLAVALLLLQVSAALGDGWPFSPDHGVSWVQVAAQEPPCAPDQPNGHPARGAGEDHCPCCPLCDEAASAPLDARVSAPLVADLTPSFGLLLSEISANRLAKRPPSGWASVWSAQGPPRVA